MCLVLIAHRLTAQKPLLVLANRDEYFARPTTAAAHWEESLGMIAGRDLQSGGSWFGIRNERWAAITNFREGIREETKHYRRSRGWLVRDYLLGELSPTDFLAGLHETTTEFPGFNLLLGDGGELWYTSNRRTSACLLPPGLYGLSNDLLDTPWPKVVRGKAGLGKLLGGVPFDQEAAFALLAETTRATDGELPDTGIPLELERALSAIFISMPGYGTRCSTLLTVEADGRRQLIERRFTDGPQRWEESRFSW